MEYKSKLGIEEIVKLEAAQEEKNMTKSKRRLCSCLLAIMMLVIPQTALAISGADYVYEIKKDGTVQITGYTGNDRDIEIPSVLDGYTVTEIGAGAFKQCLSIESVIIPKSVIEIGNSAFYRCEGLKRIAIPYGITKINDEMFYGCVSLSDITLPSSVTEIGNYVFKGCSSLTDIAIPYGVVRIGYWAFGDCKRLTSITIPYGVTQIQYCTFIGCSSLTSVTLPKDVISIGHEAFMACTSLERLKIPEGVTHIGNYVFQNCVSLKDLTLPESLISIGTNSFDRCSGELVVSCYQDSYAAQQAMAHGFGVRYLDNTEEDLRYIITDVKTTVPASSYAQPIRDRDGQPLSDEDWIGTGCRVTMDGREAVFVIVGEVNGDGIIDTTDYMLIMQHVLGISKETGAFEIACDVNGDNRIDTTDYILVMQHVLSITNLFVPVS